MTAWAPVMYVSPTDLRSRSTFSPEEWLAFFAERDEQLGEAPGTLRTFHVWESEIAAEIDDALRRRYAVPFAVVPPATEADPARVPQTVKRWAVTLFDERLLIARRYPGTDAPVDTDLMQRAQRSRDSMRDAADPDNAPLPELPLRSDLPSSSGVTKGGPYRRSFATYDGYFDAVALDRDARGRIR